jgi:hypothetical protein
MNIKFTEAVRQLGSSNIVLAGLIKKKLGDREVVRDEKNKVWITPEGMDKLRLALDIPLAVPTRHRAKVLMSAINPKWVYVKIEGKDNKHLCLVPRKLQGNVLVGKTIFVDEITDVNGTTYRHESLGA